jgi:hypothetical protein
MHTRVEPQPSQLPLVLHFIEDVGQGDLPDQLLLATPEPFRD